MTDLLSIDDANDGVLRIISDAIKRNKDPCLADCAVFMFRIRGCCEAQDHRMQPDAASDWFAVDVMIRKLFESMMEHIGNTISAVKQIAQEAPVLKSEFGPIGQILYEKLVRNGEISRHMLNVTAVSLRFHYHLINGYPRRVDGAIMADARLHYGKVIEMIKQEEAKDNIQHGKEESSTTKENEKSGKPDRSHLRARHLH